MADYVNLQAAIDAGISNMTCLRNNSKNDDGTSTYAIGIDWFHFNSATLANIYSSGNSWLGFGSSTEQMKVNRRDCAVYYEYKETGNIYKTKFFKFRWCGYSAYSSTGASYKQDFEVFLFDTGQIYLRFFTVPTSNINGTNALVCGSETISYSVSGGQPCEYTFTPSNPTTGTGWSVASGKPELTASFKSSGEAVYELSYVAQGSDKLSWFESIPDGTSVKVYTKINNGSYRRIRNGAMIKDMVSIGTLCTLSIKVDLATENSNNSPIVSNMIIKGEGDTNKLYLAMNTPNFGSAVGDITVSYDGLGGLRGYGGTVLPFSGSFTPIGLTFKGHHNNNEHINMGLSNVNIQLTGITYHNTKTEENINMGISASIVLTDIHDL